MKDDVVKGTDLTLKEKIKALNTDDRGTNPYSASNPNAPHAHGKKKEDANTRLVKGLMNGMKTSSKVKNSYSQTVTAHVGSMSKMQDIGQRIAQITGSNPYSGLGSRA
jgi:hypothetical protein